MASGTHTLAAPSLCARRATVGGLCGLRGCPARVADNGEQARAEREADRTDIYVMFGDNRYISFGFVQLRVGAPRGPRRAGALGRTGRLLCLLAVFAVFRSMTNDHTV